MLGFARGHRPPGRLAPQRTETDIGIASSHHFVVTFRRQGCITRYPHFLVEGFFMPGQILVVDDQRLPRQALASELRDAGFEVFESADGEAGWQTFCQRSPDAVVTDLAMPHADGLDLLERIRSQSEVPVILFSAYGTVQNVATAFREGATDFLSSTETEIEEIVKSVAQALAGEVAVEGTLALNDLFVGTNPRVQELRERLAALAPLDIPAFVTGEAGSGRSSAVRALHRFGSTRGGNLVRIDANTPTPDLRTRPRGAIELTDIENFPRPALADWCERIQDLERVGFARASRIFLTSALPLAEWLADAEFSAGLGRFLRHAAVEIPPLSTHLEDLPEIAQLLCSRISQRAGRRQRLSTASLVYLSEKPWPGELRELEKILERAITFTPGDQVKRKTLESIVFESEESVASMRIARLARQKSRLLEAIRKANGNISRVATSLGRSRSAVYRMIEKYDIPLERKE
jgi:DNA-binding NtrC family response regulator